MKILSLSLLFVALGQPFYDYLITIKKHLWLFPLVVFSCILAAGLDYVAIQSGYGINGVAVATTFTYFANFTIVYFFASRYFTDYRTATLKYLSCLASAGYVFVSLFLIFWVMPENAFSFKWTAGRVGLFLVFYGPVIFILDRQFALFALMKEKLFKLKPRSMAS